MPKFQLKPEVAEKYNCTDAFLNGQKLVFPTAAVNNKKAHELSLEEVDKLVSLGAVNGIFSPKLPIAPAAKAIPAKEEVKK